MNQNYQKILEQTIQKNEEEGKVPTLLLHSCCAPCSSYCLEYLSNYFRIMVYYYNPNIYPEEEYAKRTVEQQEFIRKLPAKYPISFLEGAYEKEKFYEMARGLEDVKEGGERCFRCYELRLREAAKVAKEHKMDYFTTTLSISPLKNATKLNEIGAALEKEYGIAYLYSDFKKKNGYKRSVELSKEYGMYRQYYCGCVYSKNQRDKEIAEQKERNETWHSCGVEDSPKKQTS
ncbi:MAG: epoxyqueuosine reductase QueH [Roseburia sp.]|uniref:epoxyqueuosine reductase QueH n=1 Tax=Roseburia sp. 831b TaxID=1261635 RepID=UPI000953569F|nr:epoxyqueuosine reductase QueH [Roseburia sp. 831b]MCI5918010.1 epoxyqueuosine reductase QueH [Roseburia sp.]MDD6216552.1 epoxyqueuosine reductase QueH [Roseburia sp.]MDY5881747.1 epoxyqueuosine reductase QueH [Roseburia sp.]WVK74109.1 epoxyqueuosine reductase QueH [Roseburia sp. 831b]